MTSKNLYFKLMREDWKNRLWAPALIALASFFAYPVLLAFLAGKARRDWDTAAEALKWFSKEAVNWISFENGVAVFFVVAVSLVCGLSSFHYLTSRSRVDFYHSIPVRRETLFLVHYVDGILMPAIPYALALAVSVIVCAANGVSADLLCGTAVSAYVLHMIYYILCYTTVVIASMLTGHLVIGFFGSMVLMFYMPIAATLIDSFFNSFFLSYCYQDKTSALENFTRVSPVMEYIHTVSLYGDQKAVVMAAVIAVIVSVILAAAAVFLYKKRPSEAAGKAMAFAVSQPIIRVLITVVAGLGMGFFFWSLQQSNGWMAFGVVCGSVVAHCVIESIYHFDFRKLFSHKGQLAISTFAALAILFSFRFDVFGYDSYLLSAEKVEYASVDISSLNNWVSYGNVVEDQELYGWRMLYGYESVSSEPYMAEHMQSTEVETILNFAAAGIEENRIRKSEWSHPGAMETTVMYEADEMAVDDMTAAQGTAENSETTRYTTATVTYTLKSGRKVSRNYTINLTKSYELVKKIWQDEAYQKAAYPLLAADADAFVNVRYRQSRSRGDQSLKNLTAEERMELLSTYQQEFSSLTLDQMKEEMPMGLIRFTTETDEKAIAWWNNPDKQKDSEDNVWNYYYGPDVRDQEFYPVYPSFTKTIALLEQHGVSVKNEELADKIISVTVRGYAPKSDSYQEITFTDPEEIKALGDMTRNERMLYYDPMYEEDDLSVEVTVADKTEKAEEEDSMENTYSSFFRKGEIPQIVKDRMGY